MSAVRTTLLHLHVVLTNESNATSKNKQAIEGADLNKFLSLIPEKIQHIGFMRISSHLTLRKC